MENAIALLFVAVTGWIAGLLVNYFSDGLPWKRSLAAPICASCQATMPWKKYFLGNRSCDSCGAKRSTRAWVVEIGYILIALVVWLYPHNYLNFGLSMILLTYLGVVAVIDIEHRLILHPVSVTGMILAGVLGVIWRTQHFLGQPGLVFSSIDPWWFGLWTTLLGGAMGLGFMLVFYVFGIVYLRVMAWRRGQAIDDVALGFGDVNLATVLGLLLGNSLVLPGLFLGILIGGVVSLVYMLVMMALRRYHLFMALPYGPFLIAGAIFVIYFYRLLLL